MSTLNNVFLLRQHNLIFIFRPLSPDFHGRGQLVLFTGLCDVLKKYVKKSHLIKFLINVCTFTKGKFTELNTFSLIHLIKCCTSSKKLNL